MKRLLWMIPACLLLTGCGRALPQSQEEMPPIVFEACSHDPERDQVFRSFYDRSGMYYAAEGAEMCTMRLDDLIEAYENGALTEYQTGRTCDVSELLEMHKLLVELTYEPDFGLDEPEALPAVEAPSTSWYGIYYDEDGSCRELQFHAHHNGIPVYGNDERAWTLVNWWQSTFQSDAEPLEQPE